MTLVVFVIGGDGVFMPPKSGSRQLHGPFWHCEPQQSPPSQLQAATLFSSSHQLSWYQLGDTQSVVGGLVVGPEVGGNGVIGVVVVAGVVLPPRKIVIIFYN